MFFHSNFRKLLFKNDPTKKAHDIGSKWKFPFFSKSGDKTLDGKALSEIARYNLFFLNNKQIVSGATIRGSMYREMEEISFSKDGAKKDEKESFGSLDSFKVFFKEDEKKKKNLTASFEFGPEYSASLSSDKTTKLYDYLDLERKNGSLDYIRDKNSGKLIIRLSLSKIFEDSKVALEKQKTEKDYEKNNIEPNIEKLFGAIKNQGVKNNPLITTMKELEEQKKANPTQKDALENTQKFLKLYSVKKTIESGGFDYELKHQLSEKLAKEFEKQLIKVGSDLNSVTEGNFLDMFKEKMEKVSNQTSANSSNPFYAMAYKKISENPEIFEDYKKDLLDVTNKNIEELKKDEKNKSNLIDVEKAFNKDIYPNMMNEIQKSFQEVYDDLKNKLGDKTIEEAQNSYNNNVQKLGGGRSR
jgi:hypothetical protein